MGSRRKRGHMTAERYRVIGTLIPIVGDDTADAPRFIAGAPIAVDLVVRSTHPDFPIRTAGWEVTLGHAAWGWETQPTIIRLEDEPSEQQLDLFSGQRAGEYAIPAGAAPSRCRSCDAHIVWARTEGGRSIPLSLATVEEREGVRYALAHFADCPHSKQWSKKR